MTTKIQKNIIRASVVLMLLFVIMIIAFLINLSRADMLINSPYNKRLKEMRESTAIGSIYDTNSVLLAGSPGGQRTYHSNETMRNAVSHLIGDTYGYCPTGTDIRFASVLLNYNESFFSTVSRLLKGSDKTGDDIQLTVDCRLNVFAYDQLEGYTGAVIVQDYTTGEILCMVSSPAFDPETLLEDLTINMEKEAFVNRAIQGQYAPGSMFHIVTAGAALKYIDDAAVRTFTCSGSYNIDNETIYCDASHGRLTLDEAFTRSCDSVFAQLGVELGPAKLNAFSQQLKFNYDFDYSDIALYPSNVSVSKKEENAAFAYAAIGQHEDIVSPLHMSMITGALANDGVMMTPLLLKAIDGREVSKNKSGTQVISTETALLLQEYMSHNILYGSGSDAFSDIVDIYGKSGTAMSSMDGSLYPNSWFTGYISDAEHPLTVCIITEQSYIDENISSTLGKNILEYAFSIGY